MQKHAVNLIIKSTHEPPILSKLRVFLPISAVVSLTLFVILFLSSLIYINHNNAEFNTAKTQIDNLERLIGSQKNAEGIYTLTLVRVKTIAQLKSGNKNYTKLLTEIFKLQSPGLTISQTTVDKKNSVTIAATASSSATLDDFVNTLLKQQVVKLFSDIKSSGVVRDKNGGYLLSISLQPNPSLLQ